MRSLYYPSYSIDELADSLAAFTAGDDPDRAARLARAPEFIYQNDGHTGERVKDYIYDELRKSERELADSIIDEAISDPGYRPADAAAAATDRMSGRIASAAAETVDDSGESATTFALTGNTHLMSKKDRLRVRHEIGAMRGSHGIKIVAHLGNLTDGTLGYGELQQRVASLLPELHPDKTQLNLALGDLDANAAPGNPETLSLHEQSRLYLAKNLPRYYEDVKRKHLRLIFLDSHDADSESPCGYSDACIDWLERVLSDTPPARRIVIFSHMPPAIRVANGASELRGSARLTALLGGYADRILAFFCGHGDEDYIDNECGFPVVCRAGSRTASWDAVIVEPTRDVVRSVRFGDGSDFIIEGGQARWL
jgi:hypothetical protein